MVICAMRCQSGMVTLRGDKESRAESPGRRRFKAREKRKERTAPRLEELRTAAQGACGPSALGCSLACNLEQECDTTGRWVTLQKGALIAPGSFLSICRASFLHLASIWRQTRRELEDMRPVAFCYQAAVSVYRGGGQPRRWGPGSYSRHLPF